MKIFKLTLIVTLALAIGMVSSCDDKDDDPTPITGDALFSFTTDGQTATFTNTSTVSGVVTYLWNFGDENTSIEKDPVHTYGVKGEYTVTLTVTDEQGGTHPISTKVKVDKATRIDLTDGSFSDWDAVTEAELVVPVGDNSGTVIAAKYDYDANYIYSYIQMEGTLEDIITLFIDDNADTTGFRSFLWPVMGIETLLQGQILVAEPWLEDYTYTGTGEDWSWEFQELAPDFYTVGHFTEDGGIVTFELGYAREKIPGFEHDLVKLGMYMSDPVSWAEIGFAPDMTPEGEDPTDGFLLDMR